MMPPNIARPTMNMIAVATVNTRLRNRYGGRTGSAHAPLDGDEGGEEGGADDRRG